MAIVVGAVLVVTPLGCASRGVGMVAPAAAYASPKPARLLLTVAVIPSSDGFTQAEFAVSELLPNRGYAVHAPQAPSSNSEYANPSGR